MRRRALLATAIAMPLAVAAVAIAVLEGGGEAPAKKSGLGGGSARVERRTLAERLTASGTIGYAGESSVLARLSGTITALPKVGETIRRGEPLYSIEGEPVILMYGAVPAYRDLGEGVADGEDVRQLERNLSALGYEPGTVDAEFTATTAAAVEAWQGDNGLEETGTVELGRVAFLPGARRITAIEAALGEAIGSGAGGGSETLASYRQPSLGEGSAAQGEEGSAGKGKPAGEGEADGGPGVSSEPQPQPEPEAPARGGVEAETGGASDVEAEAGADREEPEGSGVGVSVPVLKATSTRRVVSVELEANEQTVAHRGQKVLVVLPDGSEVEGRVQRLAAVEESGEEAPGGETEAAVEVTVAVRGKRRIPALDGASVSVLFTQQVRKGVLAVPVTALLAIGGDRFAVIAEEGTAGRRIVVEPGLAADGYVEVKGKGLRAGMRVETAE
jgi:peptidoglycan hydrolase-like protein with peptidoglycan-binding domain